MRGFNKVFYIGNVVRDAVYKATSSGMGILEFTIAVNESYGSGENKKEIVNFFAVKVFGKRADSLRDYITKGKPVMVEGRSRVDEYDKDGKKQRYHYTAADSITLLGSSEGYRNDSSDSNNSSRSSGAGAKSNPEEGLQYPDSSGSSKVDTSGEFFEDDDDEIPF